MGRHVAGIEAQEMLTACLQGVFLIFALSTAAVAGVLSHTKPASAGSL